MMCENIIGKYDINITTAHTFTFYYIYYILYLLHVDGNRRGEFLPVTDVLPVGKL